MTVVVHKIKAWQAKATIRVVRHPDDKTCRLCPRVRDYGSWYGAR